MNAAVVADLLRQRIGLDPLSLGANVLPNLVAQRMRTLKIDEVASYQSLVAASAAEFETLIEELVVPETWFFRGGKLFPFLVDRVRRAGSLPFRILSAACSTGEEPYSMAISLLEAGVPSKAWTIDAMDLSTRNIERARRGCYGNASLRDTPIHLRRKYFRETKEGWALDIEVRKLVRFERGNLMDAGAVKGRCLFDLIFIRNVLIYLTAAARTCVLTNLDRRLAPHGLICTGHAEPLNILDPRFQTLDPHELFLFERRKAHTSHRIVCKTSPSNSRKKISFGSPTPCTQAEPCPDVDLLLQARKQADEGELEAALQSCKTSLSKIGPSASAYSLLGLIHRARREKTDAAACFRKALYLDPENEEALMHLLLIAEEDGDQSSAELLQRRLVRQSKGGEA